MKYLLSSIVAVMLLAGCSGSSSSNGEATPQATSTSSPAPQATASPTPGGPVPGATPSRDYIPLQEPVSVTPTVLPPVTAAASWTPVARQSDHGAIEGMLIYPSEGIPPELFVCAESIEFGETYCTDQRAMLPAGGQASIEGYRLPLPPGRYFVYATLPMMPIRAYYSDFVPCGLHVGCPSHDPIVVEVRSGQILRDINPGDWYFPVP